MISVESRVHRVLRQCSTFRGSGSGDFRRIVATAPLAVSEEPICVLKGEEGQTDLVVTDQRILFGEGERWESLRFDDITTIKGYESKEDTNRLHVTVKNGEDVVVRSPGSQSDGLEFFRFLMRVEEDQR